MTAQQRMRRAPNRAKTSRAGPEAGATACPFDILMSAVASCIRMPNEQKADVLQGTLDLMVLQTLATLGPLHGYAISARIEQVSSGAIQLNMGTLYPGLLRLEQRGFIRAQWERTETNRRARYYSITAAGRRQLQTEKAEWARMAAIMQAMLEGDAG
jgi:PadR family transcriptional regulator, regulatory protein PadR